MSQTGGEFSEGLGVGGENLVMQVLALLRGRYGADRVPPLAVTGVNDVIAAPTVPVLLATACVVESAKPRWAEVRITVVAAVSAAKPWGDWMSVSTLPIVRMIRQPPR